MTAIILLDVVASFLVRGRLNSYPSHWGDTYKLKLSWGALNLEAYLDDEGVLIISPTPAGNSLARVTSYKLARLFLGRTKK